MTDFIVPKHSVVQYVRNNKRIPYGVVVGVKTPEGFALGYSLCNKKDRFNKKMALKIAIGRASYNGCKSASVAEQEPHDIRKIMPTFFERCKKYYKVNQ
jgi:hypothetical protein